MYRYSVDQAVSYTAEDFVLFRESPFACWMERLTLENPGHGIPSDVGSSAPSAPAEPQSDLAATLQEEGKNVILVEWQSDEVVRRNATLAAMRHGVDFIVNGQLAVGPLSDSADLLMRTSGYSELGNYLYIPCDTQLKTTLGSAFRLCFLADLLHSLQGQLPPQMLILRGSSDVIPLQTEDHIYHYRAVKQRFMSTQATFKKHQMPDPVESAHFGRWSDCANELLKQRALGEAEMPALQSEEERPEEYAVPQVSPGLSQALASAYDLDVIASAVPKGQEPQQQTAPANSGTLAEQARMLPAEQTPGPSTATSTDSLQNLEFIGSSQHPPTIGEPVAPRVQVTEAKPEWQEKQFKKPPPPSLRNPARVDMDVIHEPETAPEAVAVAPFSNSLITNRDD